MATAKILERPPSAQVEPARRAAALKAANEAKAQRKSFQRQASAPPTETSLAPQPERASKANRSQGPPPTWLPDPLVAKRYGVSGRTLRRWDQDPSLEFPAVIIVNSRRYRELAALEEWERRTAANARSAKAKRLEQFAEQPATEVV
jgi:hypothetical protein